MKVLAVGDVHAKDWMIYDVAEIADQYDHVIFLGDYVDNWMTGVTENLVTWGAVKSLVEGDTTRFVALVGNHDYAYLHPEIAGQSSGWDHLTYLKINDPENKELRDWLLTMPVSVEIDGVTYSHAGITDQWNKDTSWRGMWNDTSPIWARPPHFGGQVTYKNIPQVFGHSPHKTAVEIQPNIWCIDTSSQKQNARFIGDKTMLEVIDGKQFNIKDIKEIHEHNNNTSDFEDFVS